jgi:predicted transcriptional regulator
MELQLFKKNTFKVSTFSALTNSNQYLGYLERIHNSEIDLSESNFKSLVIPFFSVHKHTSLPPIYYNSLMRITNVSLADLLDYQSFQLYCNIIPRITEIIFPYVSEERILLTHNLSQIIASQSHERTNKNS